MTGGRAARGPWRQAWRPRRWWPAALALDLGLSAVAALPVAVAAAGALDEAARSPWLTDPGSPLPLVPFATLLGRLGDEVATAAIVGIGLAFLARLVVLAAVLVRAEGDAGDVGDGEAAPEGPAKELHGSFASAARHGVRRHLGGFLRVAVLAALGLVAVQLASGAAFDLLGTPDTLDGRVRRGLARVAVVAVGGWLVGIAALAARVALVADDRRYVRRTPAIVLQLWARRPVGALLLPLATVVAGFVLGGIGLGVWRQGGAGPVAVTITLLAFGLRAVLFLVTAVAVGGVYREPALAGVRATPDAPWGIVAALRRWARRLRRGERQGPR